MESNSRFVKWSDGSVQLFIGNEAYDVVHEHISANHDNYLFVNPFRQYIKCETKFQEKLVFKPSSLSSKTHMKMTASITQKHQKNKKIKLVTTEQDPEAEKTQKEQVIVHFLFFLIFLVGR